MSDDEVGELWKRHDEPAHEFSCAEVRSLIRKLVEERAWQLAAKYYRQTDIDESDIAQLIHAALRDFGIPPEEWK